MNAYLKEQEISESKYEDILDDIYGEIEICGLTYSSGRALRELDPVAFRCGKNDYESSLEEIWICGECETEYNYEGDAEECCPQDKQEDEEQQKEKGEN